MIPNLDQLLLVCGLVSLLVFVCVYVMLKIVKASGEEDDTDQASG
ncbi:hypothetical protein [Alteromonas oceanisediminis]|nr:hypothetical protein [Alteromonas oceanisediminis]